MTKKMALGAAAAAVAILVTGCSASSGADDARDRAEHAEQVDERIERMNGRLSGEVIYDADYGENGIPRIGTPAARKSEREYLERFSVKAADTDNEWLTWNTASPGMAIAARTVTSDTSTCTAGAFMKDTTRGGQGVALTAGHCVDMTKDRLVQWKPSDSPTLTPLGTAILAQDRSGRQDGGIGFDTDVAIIDVEPGTQGTPKIARKYNVTEVYSRSDLTPDMEVCKFGYRTTETCGKVIAANESFVRVGAFSLSGDSGGPAYVKLDGNKVALVGLLSGSPRVDGEVDDNITDFALIDPIMDEFGLTLY